MTGSTLSEPAITPDDASARAEDACQPPLDAPVEGASRVPAANAGRIVLAILAGIGFLLVFFVASTELLHYTESSEFCSLCHVMAPEHTAYQNSAHARAECGTCHIGPGAVAAIQAKLANAALPLGLPHRPVREADPIADPQPAPGRSRLRAVPLAAEDLRDRVVVKNEYGTDEDEQPDPGRAERAYRRRRGGRGLRPRHPLAHRQPGLLHRHRREAPGYPVGVGRVQRHGHRVHCPSTAT